MTSRSLLMGLVAFALTCSIGCGPKPVADENSADPAADVTVTTETAETTATDGAESDAAGVDVQVGGGQGVQVDVDTQPDADN